MDEFPTGPSVSNQPASRPDSSRALVGRHVRLLAPDPERDATHLFATTHGEDHDPGQWTYMSFGPFADSAGVADWMREISAQQDPLYMTVQDTSSGEPVGMISFLNIQPAHRTIELGNIWYVPQVRRSPVNTETVYLLLTECFGRLGYRRVEWKCDSLNRRSCVAAERLGFSYEGTFRQHFIVKGKSRDTAWYAMLDEDWPRIKGHFERFLYDGSCTASLTELF